MTAAITKKFDAGHAGRTVSSAKVNWYKARKDQLRYIASLVEDIDKYGVEPGMGGEAMGLNNSAWEVFETSSDPRQLRSALAWAQRAIELDPKSQGWWDTYANLLYKLGNPAKAIEAERKAVAAQEAQDADDHQAIADLELTIHKMTKGMPTWPLTPAVM
jgi:tetratricopeptide (TPR) repeat protein